jgi:hypothetical protein
VSHMIFPNDLLHELLFLSIIHKVHYVFLALYKTVARLETLVKPKRILLSLFFFFNSFKFLFSILALLPFKSLFGPYRVLPDILDGQISLQLGDRLSLAGSIRGYRSLWINILKVFVSA